MRKNLNIVMLTLLFLVGMVAQAFAVATITATPSNVPKGAYVNGPLDTGRGFVTNGDFSSATGWTVGANWAVGTGVATHTAGAATTLSYAFAVTAGVSYKLSYEVKTTTAGTVQPTIGTTAGVARAANGVYTETIVAGASDALGVTFTPIAAFDGSIDNVTVQPLLMNQDDNYFFQTIAITIGAAHIVTDTITLTVPAGMNVANIDGDYFYSDEVSVDVSNAGGGAPTLSVTSATSSQIVLTIATNPLAAGDIVYVMIPVVSDISPSSPTGEWLVAFTGGTEDITAGNGATVTYVNPGPTSVSAFTFAAPLSGVPDTTETDGEVWPAVGTAGHSAFPDFLQDLSANTVISANLPAYSLTYFENVANLNTNDVRYQYYAARDDTLSHVDENDTGVIQLFNYSPSSNYANEGFTGNQGFTVANLPEGDWYVYVVSDVTGDFPLGRSGRLTVRHWPQVDVLAWDRNASSTLISGSVNATDSANITLDSGRYVGYDGTVFGSTASTDVDIYVSVDDFDDNARVSLWRSTSSALTSADIQTSGTFPNLTVTGIGSTAVALVDTLWENSENQNGYIVWNLENLGTGTIIPAGSYTIYAVANDGKHQYIKPLQGFDSTNAPTFSGATTYTCYIKHSPNLTPNSLDEYNKGTDTGLNADVTIDQSQTDVVMLSWGKQGIDGDKDPDNACTIEFFIDYDTNADGLPDYASNDPSGLRTARFNNGNITYRNSPNNSKPG